MVIRSIRTAVPALAAVILCSGFQAGGKPEAELAGFVKAYLGMGLPTGWDGIEKLPKSKWAAGPTSLKNCLPNGDCYARQGTATIGGQSLAMVASGARTMVINILIRNMGAPLGDPAIVAAFKEAGFSADLARCPVKAGAGTNWYHLKAAGLDSAYFSIQPAGPGRPNEGYILSRGDELPPLQPAQLANYTEQCAPGAVRKPVSTQKPHEALAQAVVTLLAPAGGPALYDWKALLALPTEVTWDGDAPKAVDYKAIGDPNPMTLSGSVSYGGRKFSVRASGTATQVKTVHFQEGGQHPKGEHMLGVVYEKGIAVRLVRCGPVYTESTNNWYSLQSAKTRPANIRQSIGYDGNNVSDTYELRLDATLPPRDPRDRNPGVGGC
jgi:hypothetical protein